MRIAFTTLGCKINQYETEQLRKELSSKGNDIVPFEEQADVYIINTCTVTAKSDHQCRQLVRSAAKRAKGAKVIVTGCYASTRPDELRRIPGVQWVVGNEEKPQIAARIMEKSGAVSVDASPVPVQREAGQRTRGFLKIQDGCDNRCSYCIVPDARGRSRSVGTDQVIEQFERLVASGFPEIVLTGIHVGMYGNDLGTGASLTSLLRTLVPRRGSSRIRLSSIEPNEVTEELIGFLGNGVCRHLHLPLQSGDDRILSAMGRKYTSSFYRELLDRIARQVPGIALGADVIAGFPGESDEEFKRTMDLVQHSPLSHLHVFGYSPRPGTAAATMPHQVPQEIKKERSKLLRQTGSIKNDDFRRGFIDRELLVVVEGTSDRVTEVLSGLSDNYIRVGVLGAKSDDIGKEIRVRVNEAAEKRSLGLKLTSN